MLPPFTAVACFHCVLCTIRMPFLNTNELRKTFNLTRCKAKAQIIIINNKTTKTKNKNTNMLHHMCHNATFSCLFYFISISISINLLTTLCGKLLVCYKLAALQMHLTCVNMRRFAYWHFGLIFMSRSSASI